VYTAKQAVDSVAVADKIARAVPENTDIGTVYIAMMQVMASHFASDELMTDNDVIEYMQNYSRAVYELTKEMRAGSH
jgi:hypothetical protein